MGMEGYGPPEAHTPMQKTEGNVKGPELSKAEQKQGF